MALIFAGEHRRKQMALQSMPVVLWVCETCQYACTNELLQGDDSMIVEMPETCPECGSADWAPESN
jgi:rubrerythrin